jgi:hypothetical protein
VTAEVIQMNYFMEEKTKVVQFAQCCITSYSGLDKPKVWLDI